MGNFVNNFHTQGTRGEREENYVAVTGVKAGEEKQEECKTRHK